MSLYSILSDSVNLSLLKEDYIYFGFRLLFLSYIYHHAIISSSSRWRYIIYIYWILFDGVQGGRVVQRVNCLLLWLKTAEKLKKKTEDKKSSKEISWDCAFTQIHNIWGNELNSLAVFLRRVKLKSIECRCCVYVRTAVRTTSREYLWIRWGREAE